MRPNPNDLGPPRTKGVVQMDYVLVDTWDESRRAHVLVRKPVVTVLGPNELSDLWPRRLTRIFREALVPSTYSRPRDLSPWPDRKMASGLVRSTHGTPSVQPKTIAAKRAQEAYALRMELGDRAYAELTGKSVRRTRADATPRKTKALERSEARADIRRRADGGAPVVLSDHEMMKALGIKPVGYLD